MVTGKELKCQHYQGLGYELQFIFFASIPLGYYFTVIRVVVVKGFHILILSLSDNVVIQIKS